MESFELKYYKDAFQDIYEYRPTIIEMYENMKHIYSPDVRVFFHKDYLKHSSHKELFHKITMMIVVLNHFCLCSYVAGYEKDFIHILRKHLNDLSSAFIGPYDEYIQYKATLHDMLNESDSFKKEVLMMKLSMMVPDNGQKSVISAISNSGSSRIRVEEKVTALVTSLDQLLDYSPTLKIIWHNLNNSMILNLVVDWMNFDFNFGKLPSGLLLNLIDPLLNNDLQELRDFVKDKVVNQSFIYKNRKLSIEYNIPDVLVIMFQK